MAAKIVTVRLDEMVIMDEGAPKMTAQQTDFFHGGLLLDVDLVTSAEDFVRPNMACVIMTSNRRKRSMLADPTPPS